MRKFFLIVSIISLLGSLAGLRAGAQGADPLDFRVTPELLLPVMGSAGLYNVGGGAALEGRLMLPAVSPFFPQLLVRYSQLPTPAEKSLVLLSAGAGIGLQHFPTPRIGLGAGVDAGWYAATWGDQRSSHFFLHGAADLTYRFTPAFSLALGGSYHHFLGPAEPLYQGLGVSLSGDLRLGGLRGGTRVEVEDLRLTSVYPIFHTYYDDNAIGGVTLLNREEGEIRDVRVSFFVKQYMDQPKLSTTQASLARGRTLEAPLFALLNEQVLRLTEDTKVSAEIIVDYTFLGAPRQARFNATLPLHHRNALTWDDDRKAAAFVSAKDPAVLRYSKFAAGLLRETGLTEIDQNLRFAMGLFEGLKLYGLNYVVDPTTPYKELSANRQALDYLQYPYQTLVYKGGDCDDLSILFSAVLESVGIRTAFITIPGHIYMAFALQMDEATARQGFQNPEELIYRDGKAWVPVEITLLNEGFHKAWLIGARQWLDNQKSGAARFLPLEAAWSVYEPVGIPGEDTRIVLPEPEQLLDAYQVSLARFIDRELTPRVEKLRLEINQSGGSPRLVNRLGVLYARFGRYEEARAEFERAVQATHAPALVNLGNIAYLQKDFSGALRYYQQALGQAPDNKTALLGLARTQYELENYPEAGRVYAAVRGLDPKLATEYAYLASTTGGEARASAAAVQRTGGSAWSEE